MGLGIVGRKYLRCNDSIGSLSVMNSVPAHRSRWIRTRACCRLSASLLVYVVIWRSSGSTASHQWLLKAVFFRISKEVVFDGIHISVNNCCILDFRPHFIT
uniref:Uncharacterized protein n=1 Tax=Opuntia streptacantha TaxID=393608 RepID=A0A7C9DLM0_OPUST